MSRRIAGWTTVMLAALCPALCLAQQPYFDPQMPAPISPAGYPAPYAGGYGGASNGYSEGYCPPGQGWTRYSQMPDDRGWAFGDTELEKILTNAFRHAFFRMEYLNWAISDPGDTVLGAPVLNTNSATSNNFLVVPPTVPFSVASVVSPTGADPFAVSPTLQDVHLRNNNGIRGTWGFNFEPFTLEASVFALQAAHASAISTSLPTTLPSEIGFFNPNSTVNNFTTPLYIAQGLLVQGAPAANSWLVYDTYYQAVLRTNVWGADMKFVMTPYDLGSPLQIQPLYGLKFVNFNESLNQSGITHLTPGDSTSDQLNIQVNSSTRNYLYGPQIGLRAELVSHYLTIGAEPKLMLGANSYQARLNTAGVTDTTSVGQSISTDKTTFGAVADFQTYARGRVSEHLSVFVAFNLMWAGMITRPYENVVYNLDATGSASNTGAAFQQDVHFTDLLLYGVSVGGQVDW